MAQSTAFGTGTGAGGEPPAQGLALEQFHDHERSALVDAHVVDDAHVGVAQRPGGARLLLEPTDALGVAGKPARDDLDRDVAAEPAVVRAEHLSHPARPEGGEDRIGSERRTGGEHAGQWSAGALPPSDGFRPDRARGMS